MDTHSEQRPAAQPLPDGAIDLIAERFRAIGDATRIRILERLRNGEQTVAEITATLDCTQQNVSKHLGVLHRSGIVRRRKVGTSSTYEIADPIVSDLCALVCNSLRNEAGQLIELLEVAK